MPPYFSHYLPEHLFYWDNYIANFFVLSVLILAWRVFYIGWKTKYLFYGALYTFLLFALVIGYFATIRLPYAWILTSIGLVFCLIASAQLRRRFPLTAEYHSLLRHFSILGMLVALCLPILTTFHQEYFTWIRTKELTQQLEKSDRYFTEQIDSAESISEKISNDSEVIAAIADKNMTGLSLVLQKIKVEYGLSYITVTDPLGKVLARAHRPRVTGDNLFEQVVWSAPLFKGESLKGITYTEQGVPILVAGTPLVGEKNSTVGTVLVGYYLTEETLSGLRSRFGGSWALSNQYGILSYSAINKKSQEIALSSSFNTSLILTSTSDRMFTLMPQNTRTAYTAIEHPLTTLLPSQELSIITFSEDMTPIWAYIVDACIIVGGGIISLLALTLFRKLSIRWKK